MKVTKKIVFIIAMILFFMFTITLNNNSYAITESQVENKMGQLRNTNGYQENYCFTGSFGGASQCHGWALKLVNEIFGCHPNSGGWTVKSYPNTDVNSLMPGDVVRFRNTDDYDHTIVVTGTDANNVYYVDCNGYGWCEETGNHGYCQVCWNGSISKSDLNYKLSLTCVENSSYVGRIWHCDSYVTVPDRPTINNYYIIMHTITADSYQVWVNFNAPGGVSRVLFPTWTVANGQDDLGDWTNTKAYKYTGTRQSDGSYVYTVKKSDHNNEDGMYVTHIYVYDNYGQSVSVELRPVPIGSTVQNLGNFTARISNMKDNSKVLGIKSKSNGADVVLKSKDQNDKTQLWQFTRQDDGAYTIKNVATGYCLDVNNSVNHGLDNGALIGIYEGHNGTNQDFYPMNYNGGIRLVCRSSRDWKAVDVNGANLVAEEKIHQWEAQNTNNYAQTWNLEKVATSIKLNKTKMSLDKGKQETLTVTYTPSDIAMKSVTWKSSNPSVATVSNTGVVKGVKIGFATITATTKDGMTISKTCNVTVKNPITVKPFPDVELGKWYTDAIQYVKDRGLMSGYGKTTDSKHLKGNFGPNNNITRAEIASILYRMAENPAVNGTTTLSDIKGNTKAWYYKAVVWCNQKGIINGYESGADKGKFVPNRDVSRQDLAVMLTQYAKNIKRKSVNINIFLRNQYLNQFSDRAKISSYAKNPVAYMVKNDVISGKNNGTIMAPTDTATRAEVASMIMRFETNIN